jgi:hypothetical protein
MTSKLKRRPAEAEVGKLTHPRPRGGQQVLLMRYRAARGRLNATLDLIDRALDLRELLYCGLDLDDMVAEVAAFRRMCQRWHDRRPT